MKTNPYCQTSVPDVARRLSKFLIALLLSAGISLSAQPVPHHFSGITALPNGNVELNLDGSVSNMFNLSGTIANQFRKMFDLYPIEASSNLRDWSRLALLVRTNNDPNPVRFQDTNAAGLSQRFYRTYTNHLLTGFPTPTGPFAVGTFSHVLTDPSRSGRYGIAMNSSFMSTFWYPADPSSAGLLPGPYTDAAVAGDQGLYSYWGFSVRWADVMPGCVGHAIPGLPLVAGTNRFPIIVHSHGWTCDRRFNSQLAEELASHGYIVAAVDHEDCHATVFPDARGTCYVAPGSRDDAALLTSRVKDIQCLLDELARMDSSDPVLAERLDLTRIGVTGFSLGGGTAAESSRSDSRIQCAALLDPFIMFGFGYYPELNNQGLQKPFLAMNRTILDHSDHLWDASADSQRLYTQATKNAVWLKVTGAGHFAFSDGAWTVEMTDSTRPAASAIDGCVLWFFDTYLKGETPPFPTNAELINVQRK